MKMFSTLEHKWTGELKSFLFGSALPSPQQTREHPHSLGARHEYNKTFLLEAKIET